MMNPFVIKKYAAIIFGAFIPTILFYVGLMYYKFWYAMAFFGGGILVSVILAVALLRNPFSLMLEGKGILAVDMNSTGVMNMFIVNVVHSKHENPKLAGKMRGRLVKDIFDRSAVFNMSAPRKAGTATIATETVDGVEKTFMNLKLTEEDYNKGRFMMFQYPTIIYNSQMGSILTKDFFSDNEKNAFAEHTVLYLTKVTEDLTAAP